MVVFLINCENAKEPLAPAPEDGAVLQKPQPAAGNGQINILLNTDISDEILDELSKYGTVVKVLEPIDAVILKSKGNALKKVQGLSFVQAANPDAVRYIPPFLDAVEVEDFSGGLSTWNLDAINVTNPGFDNRQVTQDGSGVIIGVLDTGLLHTWRQYFPEERVKTDLAKSFGGGGASGNGNISEQPNKWEHDTNSHVTHVTSTILGYSFGGTPVNGVAPLTDIVPVKVLNQNGSGWSSVIAEGITYMADLKADQFPDTPVIVNMSLGGPVLDAVEKAAVDYAIDQGVIIVASAGNNGEEGMGYPGAYEPVISVAAAGWIGEWQTDNWWYALDDPDPNIPSLYYITDFSSRALGGQDLDVAAPGSWIVGPYQTNMGQTSYFFLGGTSMASPHVAGIVALMSQKDPGLTAGNAESILETTAVPLSPGSITVMLPSGATETFTWGADATGAGLAQANAALAAIP